MYRRASSLLFFLHFILVVVKPVLLLPFIFIYLYAARGLRPLRPTRQAMGMRIREGERHEERKRDKEGARK